MGLDRSDGYLYISGDFLVALAGRNAGQNVSLARTEVPKRGDIRSPNRLAEAA